MGLKCENKNERENPAGLECPACFLSGVDERESTGEREREKEGIPFLLEGEANHTHKSEMRQGRFQRREKNAMEQQSKGLKHCGDVEWN